MGCPIILTGQAQEDLREIVVFVRKDSPERAHALGHELIDQALSLGDFPKMGRMVPEVRDPVVREIVHGSYRIIYEITADPEAIYILRFWHAARDRPVIPKERD